MWKNIKAVWAEAWADAKENWKNTWDNSKIALVALVKAVAGYLLSVLQTVIWLPLYTGICKTGKTLLDWVIGKITRA